MSESKKTYCSFCGESDDQVKHMVAGPSVFICNEFVFLCDDILSEFDVVSPVTKQMQSQIDALSAHNEKLKSDAEKLIRLSRKCLDAAIHGLKKTGEQPLKFYNWQINEIEELLNQSSATSLAQVEAEAENNKWIDRNMLTPQLDMHVLVCGDDDISTSFFRRIDEGYEDFEAVGFDITHWREMPEPYANNLKEQG